MKHIVKILALVVAITVLWIGLLQTSVIPDSYTWLVGLHVIICLIFIFIWFLGQDSFWVGGEAFCIQGWGMQLCM